MKGHFDTGGKKIMKDGHGIGNIYHLLVFRNLGNKVTRRKIIRNGHTYTKHEDIGIFTKKLYMTK